MEFLEKWFEEYGIPDAILIDNGIKFFAVNSKSYETHEFSVFLKENNVQHICPWFSHPQTNGKIEWIFEELNEE